MIIHSVPAAGYQAVAVSRSHPSTRRCDYEAIQAVPPHLLDCLRRHFFGRYDAILCPPDTEWAWKHGTSFQWEDARGCEYAGAFNMSGSPAAVVRCGTSPDGMPIGVQVVGPHWREDIVLAVAGFLEKEFGGWQPPNL